MMEVQWKSMGSINCLVTDILQNILVHAGLKQLLIFWVNYSF